MDSETCLHTHIVSLLKYFHLFRCSLLHVTPLCSLLRHVHTVERLVYDFVRLSSRLAAKLCDVNFCHSLQQITFSGKSAGRTELMTHSLFKCLQEPGCVERGLRLFSVSSFPLPYISSDVRWCDHRMLVLFLSIG